MKRYDGIRIKQITQIINDRIEFIDRTYYDDIYYEFDYRGEYSLGWIVCIKDGIEVSRLSDKTINSIKFMKEDLLKLGTIGDDNDKCCHSC